MKNMEILKPHDRPSIATWIPLSFQHVFAMFGATILVPLLTGLSPSTALFTAGTGTLLFILCTGAKVPAFLGSSFSFIAPLIAVTASHGLSYALGAAMITGIFYCFIAAVVRFTGIGWLDKVLPPVVIGSVIVVIGLYLAPVAMSMASNDSSGNYSLVSLSIAAVTLGITIVSNIFLKGFFSAIPILIGLIGGYIFTLFMGLAFPGSGYDIISFQVVKDAEWFGFPKFHVPHFSIIPILIFIIVSFATICEHLGDMVVTSKIVGQDFYKNPGLHRTLTGDGIATTWAAIWGGPPNTTYSENVGVMAITRVYSAWVIGGAAIIAVLLSFFTKFGAGISTIPTPVLGGVSILLFGIIASAGLRTIVEAGVDYKDKRNLILTSVILVVGIGGGKLAFNITQDLSFELAGIALATFVGIVLNLIIPRTKKA
ncbi:MAG: NCS2 family nucleobase:cation symporter [Treponema sp.]|jgi:uracil permease|nr:NCS2 family nucleobase:cation symporter [Treponema sp.]